MLGITNHSKVPLRLAAMLGFVMSFFSLLTGLGYLIYKLMFWNEFKAGIAPVVVLARCYAIEVGSRSRATLERLEDAARAGLMDETFQASVSEAYRFLLGLRLRLQLRRLAQGKAPASEVALAELSGIERSRLKDAFRAVKTWQERAAYHYQATVA